MNIATEDQDEHFRISVDFWPEPLSLEQLRALNEMLGILILIRKRPGAQVSAEIFIDDDATTLVLCRDGSAAPTGETPE